MAELSLIGLRVLREVAARGTFTGAAESLGYTQSAISRQVAALEEAAGTPLFERRARGVRLTEAGETLLQRAGTVLDEVDAAQQELAGIAEPATGRLRVGAFPTAVAALVPRTIAGFRRRQPGVRVSLREGGTPSQLKRLYSGSVDVAVIGFLPGGQVTRDRRISLEHLIDDPLLLAVGQGHPLARRRTVDLDDLSGESWIAASADAGDTMIGAWQWADWRPRVELIAKEWTAKLGLVAAGLGVTLVPGLAADAVRSDVALVRIRSGPASRQVLVATRSGHERSASIALFSELLHDTAALLRAELRERVTARR
ncbi:MAG TPA: LysR substrate-binding domain-containing protein [Solirubrobacterales bacterium]